jgi:hypothetical protein
MHALLVRAAADAARAARGNNAASLLHPVISVGMGLGELAPRR